jgi:hypothetical protein
MLLVLAATLRLAGIDYGLPHPLVSDEEILIGGALRMAQTGSFIPTFDSGLAELIYYPVGMPYAYLSVFAPLAGVLFVGAGFPPLSELPAILLTQLDVFFLAARNSMRALWVPQRIRIAAPSNAAGRKNKTKV